MKNLVVKYYTFLDPVYSTATKGIGVTYEVSYPIVDIQPIAGVLTIITDTVSTEIVNYIPTYGSTLEVSKAVWDAAPTTGESQIVKQGRESLLLRIEKYTIRPAIPLPIGTAGQRVLQGMLTLRALAAEASETIEPGGPLA